MERFIVPYLTERPLALHRFPNGISAKAFFKRMWKMRPNGCEQNRLIRNRVRSASTISFAITPLRWFMLLTSAQSSCIPGTRASAAWISQIILCSTSIQVKRPFEDVIQVALLFHELLEEIGAPTW
jgi:DNA primase